MKKSNITLVEMNKMILDGSLEKTSQDFVIKRGSKITCGYSSRRREYYLLYPDSHSKLCLRQWYRLNYSLN